MSRVFTISITYNDISYTALLSISGARDLKSSVKVNSNENKVEIIMPNGRLFFSIPELVKQLIRARNDRNDPRLHITENITLQLLHVSA